jgi:hypothetical protein
LLKADRTKDAAEMYSMCSGRWEVGSGQDNGQWTTVSGQWTLGSGQYTVGTRQSADGSERQYVSSGHRQWSMGSGKKDCRNFLNSVVVDSRQQAVNSGQ